MPEPKKPDLSDSRTFENLKAAFTADCQDVARFRYFANRADLEGSLDSAVLFRAATEGQATRTLGHLEFLSAVCDPVTRVRIGANEQNLRAAISRTSYEGETMYVNFAKTAREEGFDAVAEWFESLAAAELQLQRRFELALASLGPRSSDSSAEHEPLS
ncbi:MAG: rubrerythrin family protein [Planctomycetes bacterium]|nr:rubrerythrin family protein [Planctomycetota bacterium]